MISTILTGFVSFLSTNIDDIFVLMLFFSQVNAVIKRRHIIIGQFLGIGTLTAISILGALGVSIVPHEYVGLLGVVPIYLGIKAYIEHKKEDKTDESKSQQDNLRDENNGLEKTSYLQGSCLINITRRLINPNVIKVTSVTIANGGDNIGIYIPLFASMSLVDILIVLFIFLFLTGIWCFIGLRFSRYPFVQRNIERNKHIIVPIIFIGIGVYILIKSGAISFILINLLR